MKHLTLLCGDCVDCQVIISSRFLPEKALEGGEYLIYLTKFWDPMVGISTKNSSEKSNAPHMPGVRPPLGLNIDRCITCTVEAQVLPNVSFFSLSFKLYASFVYTLTAPFNNMRTLKFKAQPTNAFFATVNQMLAGSSQLSTAAERVVIKSLCTVQTTNRVRQ